MHRERESELKRKRGEDQDQEEDEDGASGGEAPKEGLKTAEQREKAKKRRKLGEGDVVGGDEEEKRRTKVEKRREKRERKKALKARRKEKEAAWRERKKNEKREGKKEGKSVAPAGKGRDASREVDDGSDDRKDAAASEGDSSGKTARAETTAADLDDGITHQHSNSSASASPEPKSPVFDNSAHHSSASSSSSIVPPSANGNQPSQPSKSPAEAGFDNADPKINSPVENQNTTANAATQPPNDQKAHPKLPKVDTAILQQRLEARIAALRAARKADGPDGKPARTRQDLIESRRRRDEVRKAHKKELRAQARVQKDAEQEAARLRGGSGSPLWQQGAWDDVTPQEKRDESFEFGKVAFADGAEEGGMKKKKKGPSDAKTALLAAQKKAARLSGYDSEKRAEIDGKDRWLGAAKRVQGEKGKDDESLLKKTLKRKERSKRKSEREWKEREQGVRKGKEMRQKKREENLTKRREEKGKKGKKVKGKGKGKKTAVRKRPGFEGSFRAGKAPRL